MPDTTRNTLNCFIANVSQANQTPVDREEAYERGRQAAVECIEAGVPISLRDEAPGLTVNGDAEAMGWNSMVFSDENKALREKRS